MAKFDLIVRGGRVIDPASGIDGAYDVAVKDGTIAQVAPRIAGTAARTINARNQLVIPGMIDMHQRRALCTADVPAFAGHADLTGISLNAGDYQPRDA